MNDGVRREARADLFGRREYATLNAIRGVAAIGVVLFHGVALVGTVVPRGYLAVDLFFVLSGFVIAHAYGGRLGSGLSLRDFSEARLIRFWPLYALGLALGLGRESLLALTGNNFALPWPTLFAAALTGLFFVPFPLERRDGDLFPLNIPSWSLFFELLVNLLYAVARPVLGRGVLVGVILVSAVAFVTMVPARGIGHVGVSIDSFGAGCVRTILSFAIGLLIHRLQPQVPRVPRVPAPVLLALVAAALMVPWGGLAYDLVFVLLLGPLIVALGAATEPGAGFARVATWLGVISFPLYAVHRPILGLAEAIATRVALPPAVAGWGTLVVLLAISAPLAALYDAPVRGRATRFLRRV
ncbi:acyltransferase family protein [Sphingomonas faeni]|uniref:acyltransferase family protein n=1 Tax=Sphingomonas faeni TaxID=185950 RepID=UPI00334AB5C8